MSDEQVTSSGRKQRLLRSEIRVEYVPLPPERVLSWRSAVAEVYKILEEALARERAAAMNAEAK